MDLTLYIKLNTNTNLTIYIYWVFFVKIIFSRNGFRNSMTPTTDWDTSLLNLNEIAKCHTDQRKMASNHVLHLKVSMQNTKGKIYGPQKVNL